MEDYKKLNYENEFGSFSADGSEYWIRQSSEKRIPIAWSNILTNDKFGCVITDTMGGYTWYINSQTNRVTPFENDSFTDKSFENISFTCEDIEKESKIKTLDNDQQYFYTCFGFGYAKYFDEFNEIKKETDIFIPQEETAKIYIIKLKNISQNQKKITIKYNIKWQMADKINHSIIVENYKENLNIFEANNLMNNNYTSYVYSSEVVNNITKTENDKIEKNEGKFNKNKEIKITLNQDEEKEILIIMGVEEKEENIIKTITSIIENYNQKFENTLKYWKEQVTKITAKTPMESFNVMQNGWLCYQTLASRIVAKTGYYQSSGGYGFRDQLQDAMGMKWINPDILKNQIIYNASHQFEEGDVEHWWHEDSKLGIRARYSDDMLWLPYAVLEYIDFTEDYGILREKAGFIHAEELKDGEQDRVDYYRKIEGNKINFAPYKNQIKKDNMNDNTQEINQFSIFEHCIRAIKNAWNLGEHNIPLIKNGDWNDGMNKIGNSGKGESVWLGFFLYNILIRFTKLIEYIQKNQTIKNFSKDMSICLEKNLQNNKENISPTKIDQIKNYAENLDELKQNFIEKAIKIKESLNTTCWDGMWYIRAFDDNGNKVGSSENEECKIDSICQSFSVITGAGDQKKAENAMQSLENYLIDSENNVVKLLSPSLENTKLGYISSYAKGMRENGGQYTHAAIWAMIAEIMLNRKEQAMQIYKMVNPVEHTLNVDKLFKYKVEPYVVAGDIYGDGNLIGRGGWTWYTGSSAWLYDTQIKYILGIQIKDGKMKISPNVPNEWKTFEVNLKWKDAYYKIKYYNIKNNINKNLNEIELKNKGSYTIEVKF